jgi:hypothetical protein
MFLMLSDASAATTVDDGSFGTLYDAITSWIQGSLGYVIALLGMIGSLIWYMLDGGGSKGWSIIPIGMLLSVLVGGAVGISQTMFNLGSGSF